MLINSGFDEHVCKPIFVPGVETMFRGPTSTRVGV